jgi:hypothetical protein
MPFLEFLTKPGCHLCEDAEPVVLRAAELTRSDLVTTDIHRDDELAVDWGLRIPVVRWSDGSVLAEGRISLGPLTRAIARKRFGELLGR